jgi:hypothetical protein
MTASHIPATATGIACAKCSHWSNGRKIVVHHANVAAVKACHQGASDAVEVDPFTVARPYATPDNSDAINAAWASAKQAAADLERQHEIAAYEAKMARDEELEQVNLDRTVNPWPSKTLAVRPGRYAVEVDGTLKFYKVDQGKAGTRWAGRTFVSVQASDELFPVRNPAARQEIMTLIARDPEAAMRRYGQELGSCGHCGRTLTDASSRAAGIGPICADKGW